MKSSITTHAQLQNSQKMVNFGDTSFDICLVASDRFFCLKYLFIWQQLAIEQGCREVSQLAPVLHAQGITPTAKNLRKFMHHPSSLWQTEVIEVLRQIRLDLPQ